MPELHNQAVPGHRSVSALRRVLADPHTAEEDWLAASYELELYEIEKADFRTAKRVRDKQKTRILALTACCFAGAGIYFWTNHATPASAPATKTAVPPAIAKTAIDYGPYMANLQRKIKRNWFPPKGDISRHTQVIFKVHEDGSITNLRLSPAEEDDAYTRTAIYAVNNCGSFNPLPPGSPENVDIQFYFDYHCLNQQDQFH